MKIWMYLWIIGWVLLGAMPFPRMEMANGAPSAGPMSSSEKPAIDTPASTVTPSTMGPRPLSGGAGMEKGPDELEPLFVRLLMKAETGRNDSNPRWSPRGGFLTFEGNMGDAREVRILLKDGTPVQTIAYSLPRAGDASRFLSAADDESSYNAGITWSPAEDRFVFMSNGGAGNYDLYLQALGTTVATRLTSHKEKDGQAHWSPNSDRIVFVSGMTGNGDVYLMDLPKQAVTRLTPGDDAYLYPRWSPDGGQLVMMSGGNENHDILLVMDVAGSAATRKMLTTWASDDLRPAWSPDGKKIAFYTNFNAANDLRQWALIVIAADGSDPAEGVALAEKIVATDVLPDIEAGPAWMPDSNRIVFVKNDRKEYNRLFVADLGRKTVLPIRTGTRMNRDVSISVDGTVAFRAQLDQWDRIYTMKLKD